jgi:serine/threonine-protein kinase
MADCLLCGTRHPDEPPCRLLRTGQQVGKLTLGTAIGVGGIAAVYEAKHPVLAKTIAVKILHKRYAKDAELSARFVREARETAALGHPAFVAVHDAGTTDDGCAYIEMDRLEGRELYSLRKDTGPMPPERVVWLAISILDALTVLHGRGVIHRDLKTQNIYIVPTPSGDQVKLLDLGFAKVEDELKLTSKEQILGTPFYISPEQYTNPSGVDARADLFSLGVVMFELLVGDWPYTWKDKRDLLGKVMDGDLERHPIARRPDVPPWLDAIVAKSLAYKKEDRFEDAAAMKAALEQGPSPAKSGLLRRLFGG